MKHRKYVLILVGKCASGKSTISESLRKKLKLKCPVLDIGKFRRQLKVTKPKDDILAWFKLGKRIVKEKRDIIYTTTNMNLREQIIRTVFKDLMFSRNVIYIVLKCEDEILLKRLKKRGYVSDKYYPYKGITFEDLNKGKLGWPNSDFGYKTIHTDKLTKAKSIKEIVGYLKRLRFI